MRIRCTFLLLLTIASCQFIPEGDNFQDRAIPDPPAVSIAGLSDNDILYVAATIKISLKSSDLGSRKIFGASLRVDGISKTILTVSSNEISFSIIPTDYPNAIHQAELTISTSSGSGSLQDVLDNEKITLSKKFKFETDNTLPSKVKITEVKRQNGGLQISWTPDVNRSFTRYEVYLDNIKNVETKEATFIDQSYFIGGSLNIQIQSYNLAGKMTASDVYTFKDQTPPLTTQKTFDAAEIKWKRSGYPSAFQAYLVRDITAEGFFIDKKTNIMDTSIVIDMKSVMLGAIRAVSVTAIPKSADLTNPVLLTRYPVAGVAFYRGIAKQPHSVTAYSSVRKEIYTRYQSRVFRLGADNLDTLAQTSLGTFAVSNSGQYMYCISSNQTQTINPQTFALLSTRTTSSLTGSTSNIGILNVADNNMLMMQSSSRIYLINMNTNTLVFQVDGSNGQLSADGQYLYDGSKLYQFNGTSYVVLRDYTGLNYKFYFNPDLPAQAVILQATSARVTVIDVASGNTIRTFTFTNFANQLQLDPTSNHILLNSSTGLTTNDVYDLSTGTRRFTFSNREITYLFNNRLLRNGYTMSMDDYHYSP